MSTGSRTAVSGRERRPRSSRCTWRRDPAGGGCRLPQRGVSAAEGVRTSSMWHDSCDPLEELGYGGGGVIDVALRLYGGGSMRSVGMSAVELISVTLSGVVLLDSG